MDCHICNRSSREGCLVDPMVPYVTFLIRHPHGHNRMYAGKVIARGNAGYRIATPGGEQHRVKFHRVRCAEPRIFNLLVRSQCGKKRLFVPELDPETYTTVYYDGQMFGDL